MQNQTERESFGDSPTTTGPKRLLLTLAGLVCVGLAAAGAVLQLLAKVRLTRVFRFGFHRPQALHDATFDDRLLAVTGFA